MTNAELIKVLRYCGKGTGCSECPIYHEPSEACFKIGTAAADALEAADKRIADLETALAACRARNERSER